MYSRTQPSQDYVDLLAEYKELHKDPKYFNGICLRSHINTISNIIIKEGAKSLLDYGCGKAFYMMMKNTNQCLNKRNKH